MEFIIDSSLKINEEREPKYHESAKYFLERHFDFSKRKIVAENVTGADFYHRNYLSYLEHCWDKHLGIIISPDIIWHLILMELAGHIKEQPETYRSLFSTSTEKIEIKVPYNGPVLDLNAIVAHLKDLVPTNTDLFVPEFSTTDAGAAFAFQAAFADAMSPYYNYSMYMCGVSKIQITGTPPDWGKMLVNIRELKNSFPIIADYFERISNFVATILKQFSEPDVETMRKFFALERCGSGGQVEVEGWVTDLYLDNKPRVAYPQNFSASISVVSYKLIETNQKFELRCGLFSSILQGDYLVPGFSYVVHELESEESNNNENNRRSEERVV
jgi:hypothetical protein